ncbi:MAG: putative HTH-type transcriptional regulator [bacterium]|nr:putative HTH-type transcriptional regulator [bacterium]
MLSTTTEYALRALSHLAAQGPGASRRSQEIAEETAIPANYLSKILRSLATAGILRSARGVGGGYALARPMEQIHLIEIAELFDGVRAIPHCVLGSNFECSDVTPCGAHEEWKRVRTSYISFLEKTSLAAIAKPGTLFRDRPHILPPGTVPPGGSR